MKSGWRSGMVVFIGVLLLTLQSVPRRAAAQEFDIAAAQKRFQALYAAGDYAAALAEAQRNEAAAKRGGTNNLAYVLGAERPGSRQPGVGPVQ